MSSASFTTVDLEQGTAEWLAWRRGGIGASDMPTIMGENPWKTASQLLDEKCSELQPGSSAAMARGSALEPEARSFFETKIGLQMMPACLQSVSAGWLRCSVDGMAADWSRVVEIKCGESVYRKTALSRQVPPYYVGQLQHILAVTNLASIDFWCYLPGRPEVHLVVPRDENYITRLVEVGYTFWIQAEKRRAQLEF